MNKFLAYVIVSLTLVGCDPPTTVRKTVEASTEPVPVDSVSRETEVVENQFSHEHWQHYTDSLQSYFDQRVGWKIKNNWKIDTMRSDDYTLYDYHGGTMHIEIYEFETMGRATHFFNELKTKEYIQPFGLNKRPNHILVDSNRVYWHHMEHAFGHRMEDLNRIFAYAFDFHPESANLDSVSGFNYCKCINENESLHRLIGDWVVEAPIQIHIKPHEYWSGVKESSKCQFDAKDGMKLKITADSIVIDGLVHHQKAFSSFELPDNNLYWKYAFPLDTLENYRAEQISEAFIQQTMQLRKHTNSIRYYHITLKGWCDMTILDIKDVGTYCFSRGLFHRMKRT